LQLPLNFIRKWAGSGRSVALVAWWCWS